METECLENMVLPWSEGALSVRIRCIGSRTTAAIPELGLYCYGASKAEVGFRLYGLLLQYYRQLKTFENRLGLRAAIHLSLLSIWVRAIEDKIKNDSFKSKVINFRTIR
jgi:hypothetical protein